MARGREAKGGQPGDEAEVRTLGKGLEILALFQADRHTITVEEVARELGFPKSSTYRLMNTLRLHGYVRRVAGGEGFTLDPSLLRFGEVVRAASPLYDVARPYMEELVAVSKESSGLIVRTGDSGTIVARVDSPEMMRFMPEVGWSFPLHSGAAGKVLLAYAAPEEQARYLDRELRGVTDRTIVDPDELRRQLAETRERGYAIAEEEPADGILALAVPVFEQGGEAVAGLSLVGPIFRFTRERAAELVPAMTERARRMSSELGASPRT